MSDAEKRKGFIKKEDNPAAWEACKQVRELIVSMVIKAAGDPETNPLDVIEGCLGGAFMAMTDIWPPGESVTAPQAIARVAADFAREYPKKAADA